MADWHNKVAVITGASRGIGAGLARHCAELGMQVVAAATNLDKLKELEHSIQSNGGSVLIVQTDVADPDAVQTLTHADLDASEELTATSADSSLEDVSLTQVERWQVLGQSVPHVDGRDIVTGAHRFPSDVVRPGMLYGKILRAPSYGATLSKIDLTPAEKMKDVTVVRDGGFVGCSAATSRQAQQALDAIGQTAEWQTPDHPSSRELFSYLKQHAVREGAGRRGPRSRTK